MACRKLLLEMITENFQHISLMTCTLTGGEKNSGKKKTAAKALDPKIWRPIICKFIFVVTFCYLKNDKHLFY